MALRTCFISTLPVQGTIMIFTFDGYCILMDPARSAAAYEHQRQQKAIIEGSKTFSIFGISPFE
jgi:hypothetical protein